MLAIKEIVGFLGFLTGTLLCGVLTALIAADAMRRPRAWRRLLGALTVSGTLMLLNGLYLTVFTITRVSEWRHTIDSLLPALTLLLALSPVAVVLSVLAATWILATTYRAHMLDGILKHVVAIVMLGLPLMVGTTQFPALLGSWGSIANPSLRQALATTAVFATALVYWSLWHLASRLVDRVYRRPDAAAVRLVLEPLVGFGRTRTELLSACAEILGRHFKLAIVVCLRDGEVARRLSARVEGACLVDTIVDEPTYRQLAESRAEAAVIIGDGEDGVGLIGVAQGRDLLARDLAFLRIIGIEATRMFGRVRREESRRAETLAQETAARLSAEAKLSSLRAQMNPHFLFNTLNAIADLIDENPSAAVGLVEDLSELLRRVLGPGRDLVTLREELELVDAYVHIEQARLGDRLIYDTHIDVTADAQRVPVLSIQPLVENAIQHGAIPHQRPCHIHVSTVLRDGVVTISVRDDGVGYQGTPSGGVGLNNVSSRLRALYGPSHQVTFDSRPGEGTTVSFSVPAVGHDPAEEVQT